MGEIEEAAMLATAFEIESINSESRDNKRHGSMSRTGGGKWNGSLDLIEAHARLDLERHLF